MSFFNMFPSQMSNEFGTPGQQEPTMTLVLHIDSKDHEIDEQGHVIDKPKIKNLSTLKVNFKKQKNEAFQILRP